ncbi:hypothetical protein [Brassicibacter mesophilus]|uniref:hypothetical protein n=1 Tax=Brassicibacter mesophilus TaxID=745119 RepID=UPI003D1B2377
MKSKLIIVEGLPGSGKSTAAKTIKELLDEYKISNELILEGNLDHPADYDGVAYFTKNEYDNLLKKYKQHYDFIEEISEHQIDGIFIPFVKLRFVDEIEFPDGLFDEIAQHDIYELTFEVHRKLLVERWERFAELVKVRDEVYIFECCFIQNPVTVSMIRDNAEFDITKAYIKDLEKAVAELNPILIYLNQDNIEESFKRIIEERPIEWYEGFLDYYTNQGYGKEHNLYGLEGTLEILKERKSVEQEIIDLLEIKKAVIDNTDMDLNNLKNQIKNILEV